VHAKILQKDKEMMSINYTATISMNYTTLYSIFSRYSLLFSYYLV